VLVEDLIDLRASTASSMDRALGSACNPWW
jgi:hypothetical protein